MNGLRYTAKVIVGQVMDVSYSPYAPQSNATAGEYASMVGLTAAVMVPAVGFLRQQLIPGFQAVTDGL